MTTTAKKTTRKTTTKSKETVEAVEVEAVVKRPKNFRELRKMLTRDTEVLIMNNKKMQDVEYHILHFYYLRLLPNLPCPLLDGIACSSSASITFTSIVGTGTIIA